MDNIEDLIETEPSEIDEYKNEIRKIRDRDAHIFIAIMNTIDSVHSERESNVKKGTKADNGHHRGYQKALKDIFFSLNHELQKIVSGEEYGKNDKSLFTSEELTETLNSVSQEETNE